MRARPQEYLIHTKIGKATRKIVWQCDKDMDLDLPRGWKIAKVNGRIRIWDSSNPSTLEGLAFDAVVEDESPSITLPSAKQSRLTRPITVKLRKLRAPRPVYVNNPTLTALHTQAPRQLCAFYGQRYFLILYRPVGTSHTLRIGRINVFAFKKSPGGYTISAEKQPLRVNTGGKKVVIPIGGTLELPEVDFFRSTVLQGIHWWRFRMVPTPNGQPPLETDETDEDLREVMRLQYSTVAFISIFAVLMLGLFVTGKLFPPTVKVIKAEVTLRQPKIFPAFEEKKVILPPEPPPPKKVAEVEPPKPPEPPKPKPKEKPRKVAKAVPKAQKIAPKVAKVKLPEPKQAPQVQPPPEPKVVKEVGPTPEQLAAVQKAKEQQAEQQQMLKSLNFLSTSKSRPNVEATTYESKTGKFSDTPMVGGIASKSNVLDKMVKGAPGDGNIDTKSGRTMASTLSFGKNKGLNDVQGKVSMDELASKDGNPGSALGGGKGLEMTGPGELSESQIEKALSKFLAKFQYCYEKSLLSDSSLSGNLNVQWTITVAGRVGESRVVKSQLNNNDLHKCVLKVLAEVPFPKPKGGSVTVKKVFTFSSSSM